MENIGKKAKLVFLVLLIVFMLWFLVNLFAMREEFRYNRDVFATFGTVVVFIILYLLSATWNTVKAIKS